MNLNKNSETALEAKVTTKTVATLHFLIINNTIWPRRWWQILLTDDMQILTIDYWQSATEQNDDICWILINLYRTYRCGKTKQWIYQNVCHRRKTVYIQLGTAWHTGVWGGVYTEVEIHSCSVHTRQLSMDDNPETIRHNKPHSLSDNICLYVKCFTLT